MQTRTLEISYLVIYVDTDVLYVWKTIHKLLIKPVEAPACLILCLISHDCKGKLKVFKIK